MSSAGGMASAIVSIPMISPRPLRKWMNESGSVPPRSTFWPKRIEMCQASVSTTPPPLLSTDPSSSWTASSPEAVPVVWSRKACRRSLRA